jgi:hypothetical protein
VTAGSGEVFTAKQPPQRPGITPALGLRAGKVANFISEQTMSSKEKSMWFQSVLDYVKPGSAQTRPSWARRVQRRTPRARRAKCQLSIEALEDRCLLSGVSFMDPVDYAAGRSPRSVAAGDFRGIGVQDLAVANSGSNDVSIFLGNGDGTFRLAETVVVGVSPFFITTGHFHDATTVDLAIR